jgi:hypothetical protein
MVATDTKPTQLESTSTQHGTNGTGDLLALFVPAAAFTGLLLWFLADWKVYSQGSEGLFYPSFRLDPLEQLTVSTVAGVLLAGVPFGLFWLVRSRAAGSSWLDRCGLLLGIGGAALGWTLLYLAWRTGGDFWTHMHFLGLDAFSYAILGLAALLVTQSVALAVGLVFWRTPCGKAAVAASVMSALLFAGILAVPLLWDYLLHS